MTEPTSPSQEVDDLLASLAQHRRLLLFTLPGITDDQARNGPR